MDTSEVATQDAVDKSKVDVNVKVNADVVDVDETKSRVVGVDVVEAAMAQWVRSRAQVNGSQLARDINAAQPTISRWQTSGAKVLSPALRDRVVAYWTEQGITAEQVLKRRQPRGKEKVETDVEKQAAPTSGAAGQVEEVSGEAIVNEVESPAQPALDEQGEEVVPSPSIGTQGAQDAEEAGTSQREGAVDDVDSIDAVGGADEEEVNVPEGATEPDASDASDTPVVSPAAPDARPASLSVVAREPSGDSPESLALEMGAPILALLPLKAARVGAQALANGWRWKQDAPPEGIHGDALLYLHTREDVHFYDKGALRVSLAPDTYEFPDGLMAAKLRFGVHPRRRQERYAVLEHRERPLLIGERLAALIPEHRSEDDDWFFGSYGITTRTGEWWPSAAELIALRRLLKAMLDAFGIPEGGVETRRLLLVVAAEMYEVEATLLSNDYGMSFGEQVAGQRTWPPSVRLGIETDWRVVEIQTLNLRMRPSPLAAVARVGMKAVTYAPAWLTRKLTRRALRRAGLWDDIFELPMRRALRVVRSGRVPSRWSVRMFRAARRLSGVRPVTGAVCGAVDWTATAPPWSEQYHSKWRPHLIPDNRELQWRPHEFDEEYEWLPDSGATSRPSRRGSQPKSAFRWLRLPFRKHK